MDINKEKADKIRLQILALSDEDLVFAESESFGTSFQSLSELIKFMADKCKRELPF